MLLPAHASASVSACWWQFMWYVACSALAGWEPLPPSAPPSTQATPTPALPRAQPLPPLTQATWRLAMQTVTLGSARWDPAHQGQNPHFWQYYQEVWRHIVQVRRRSLLGTAACGNLSH